MTTYNARYTDPYLVQEVVRRDRLRQYHRELAALDNQVAIARDMDVPQSIISKLVLGQRLTAQLTPEQRREAMTRYARSQKHTRLAREHGVLTVCRDLGICLGTRARILDEYRQRQRAESRRSANATHNFLTRRLVA